MSDLEMIAWGFAALVAIIVGVMGSGDSYNPPDVGSDGFDK